MSIQDVYPEQLATINNIPFPVLFNWGGLLDDYYC